MKRWLIISLAILVVAIIATVLLRKPTVGKTVFRSAVVSRGDLVRTVNATGNLEAVTTVQVGSQVSGTIAALYADFNSKVRRGQPLALLDTTFLATQVAEAQANVAKATAAMNEAKRNYQRSDSLSKLKLISGVELDQATTGFETAQANLTATKAALLRAKTNLNYAHINSPIEGTVISRNYDVGQTVAASLNAPTLFVIAQDLAKMRLMADVDEADIGQIAVDNPVTFSVDAFPDRSFHGTVEQIRLSPQVQQNVVTYTVVIGVDNTTGRLMPGMTATVQIETAKRTDILKIPSSATRFRPPMEQSASKDKNRAGAPGSGGNKREFRKREEASDGTTRGVVYTMDTSTKTPVKKPVRIGLTTESEMEIVEGLSQGDSILVGMINLDGNNNSQQATNPFNPMSRGPGGGPGGGGPGGGGRGH